MMRMRLGFLAVLALMLLSIVGQALGESWEQNDLREGQFEKNDFESASALDDTPWFVLPFYSKLSRADLLDNQTRAGIFAQIEANPGITFSTIAKELKLPHGTLQHHLRVLEKSGFIISKRLKKYTRFYLATVKASDLTEVQEKIFSLVCEKQGLCETEIGEELSISKQTVSYNLRHLEEEGFVDIVREGRKARCFPTNNCPQ
ncbi:MAG: helix-turn-helix domain-containing protein [Methanobacteriota archaeon]|nr:MAG: helix-turn-helix domain-containing protein [Euryarchaeota archaeon]